MALWHAVSAERVRAVRCAERGGPSATRASARWRHTASAAGARAMGSGRQLVAGRAVALFATARPAEAQPPSSKDVPCGNTCIAATGKLELGRRVRPARRDARSQPNVSLATMQFSASAPALADRIPASHRPRGTPATRTPSPGIRRCPIWRLAYGLARPRHRRVRRPAQFTLGRFDGVCRTEGVG